MEPIYFPFTAVSRQTMAHLTLFFRPIRMLRPSAAIPDPLVDLVKKDLVVFETLPAAVAAAVERLIREYRTWQQHHHGAELSTLPLQPGKVPFFGELSEAQIRKTIKNYHQPDDPPENGSAALIQAALFLRMAETYDLHNQEVDRGLRHQDNLAGLLMDRLRGERVEDGSAPDAQFEAAAASDAAAYMLPERMRAWVLLLNAQPSPTEIMITSSRTALEALLAVVPGDTARDGVITINRRPSDPEKADAFRRDLLRFSAHLLSGAQNKAATEIPPLLTAGEPAPATLTLYPLVGIPPHMLFAHYLKKNIPEAPETRPEQGRPSTILGLIEKRTEKHKKG